MLGFRKLKNLDWILILVSLFLYFLGTMVVYSTTSTSSGFSFLYSQVIFGLVGFFSLFILASLDYRFLKNITQVLYIAMIFFLLLVLIIGSVTRGATSWIDIGFFRFQPSEPSKLILIICLAKFFSQKGDDMFMFKNFIISMLYMALPVFLVLLQPDFGTAIVMVFIWFGMVIVSGARKLHIFSLITFGLVSIPIIYQFFLKDYQKKRLLNFLNPGLDPQGSGYNVLQAIIAVGSGQMFGRGLGHGPQSQLKFLPERYNDFIFSVLAEELGFAGAILLLILFAILIARLLKASSLSSDNFGSFLAIGMVVWIIFQSFVNIGMNIGIMPVTGIPLPLISAGGSSTISVLAGLGIVLSVLSRHKRLSFKG